MESIPVAHIGHQSSGRVRFKIESRRGSADYFLNIETSLQKEFRNWSITTAPLTGSLLVSGDNVDAEPIIRFAAEQGLFTTDRSIMIQKPLAKSIGDPILSASEKIREYSGGAIDMPGMIFITALMFGAYEIIRGNFRTPPWYTAFWYAFGVYSKSYFDTKNASGSESR